MTELRNIGTQELKIHYFAPMRWKVSGPRLPPSDKTEMGPLAEEHRPRIRAPTQAVGAAESDPKPHTRNQCHNFCDSHVPFKRFNTLSALNSRWRLYRAPSDAVAEFRS